MLTDENGKPLNPNHGRIQGGSTRQVYVSAVHRDVLLQVSLHDISRKLEILNKALEG